MIQLTKIDKPNGFKTENKKIEFVYKGWEEPNRGQEIVYYGVLINGVDKTLEFFSEEKIQLFINEKIETEHPEKNFVFIPYSGLILVDILNFNKTSLAIYFRENGNTIRDRLVGSFFYEENHLLINQRSLTVTNLTTLQKTRVKFEKEIDIEWAFFINSKQIQVIQAFSNNCFVYDLEVQKMIKKSKMINESIYPDIFRWIYRGQQYQTNELQMELLQKKEGEFRSTYFKIK
ncbi:hypothetical protein HYN56_14000 [Flavobacterium crocinum]|uniref:Uncharacterized protein n=1 Tax=Flavobacterium crocinum TaxID=2183896 RepID=A0A2S1YMH0_9FLAO|nr:hypothetical protein [Flavobacterium crocinum]AWK05287.1 hypothetical protein HYN56_14000 [Flavobacterium crocinum]